MISREEYIELIKNEYPNDYLEIIDGLSKKRSNALRINTLKITTSEALKRLDDLNIIKVIFQIFHILLVPQIRN